MSSMVNPDIIPAWLMERMRDCESCEADRRPRVFMCTYHVGFEAGWEERERVALEAVGLWPIDTRPDPVATICPVHGSALCPEDYMLRSDGTPWTHYTTAWNESLRCGRRPKPEHMNRSVPEVHPQDTRPDPVAQDGPVEAIRKIVEGEE